VEEFYDLRLCAKQIMDTAAAIASAEEYVASLEDQLDPPNNIFPSGKASTARLSASSRARAPALLSFAPKLPLFSIVGQLEKLVGERAACVKRELRGSVETAKVLGMYKSKTLLGVLRSRKWFEFETGKIRGRKPLLSVARLKSLRQCAPEAEGEFFTFGYGWYDGGHK